LGNPTLFATNKWQFYKENAKCNIFIRSEACSAVGGQHGEVFLLTVTLKLMGITKFNSPPYAGFVCDNASVTIGTRYK